MRVFNTPVKNGSAKMTWNSPFQSLQPANTATVTNGPSQNIKELLFDTVQDAYEDDLNFTGSIIDFSALNSENQLSNMNNSHHQQPRGNIPAFNTDIPVLDDLFSDLNSDLNSLDGVGKSEPVNFEDIERILLPQQPRKSNNYDSSI